MMKLLLLKMFRLKKKIVKIWLIKWLKIMGKIKNNFQVFEIDTEKMLIRLIKMKI